MKVAPTTLPGVLLVQLDVYTDHRGRFVETYRRERYTEAGITAELVQDNFSSSAFGVLRGLHYQLRQPQGKLVHVTRGEVYDVAVDIRRDSPAYGRWFGTLLSAANGVQMWIPPGFAHGFLVTSPEGADVVYKVTAPYSPGNDRAIRWDDIAIGVTWPLDGRDPIVSDKDREAPLLRDAELA